MCPLSTADKKSNQRVIVFVVKIKFLTKIFQGPLSEILPFCSLKKIIVILQKMIDNVVFVSSGMSRRLLLNLGAASKLSWLSALLELVAAW